MDAERLKRIQSLFLAAADLPLPERDAFLKTACGDDTELAADVLSLLREDSQTGSVLDGEVADVARQMFGHTAEPLFSGEFGPYRLREILGEGGMGVVYLAERQDLHSLVAIKILRDAGLSPARRERFASEQRTLALLNHPAIARFYDANVLADGTPWFVMEYVEGVPITEFCLEHRPSLDERLRLFRRVCEAVQYAHEHAVIHRDLKPSNILVRPDGAVKLLDFGIAKQLESHAPPEETRTALRMMTVAYASPEQIRGQRVGVSADVYALGVILYELLTGHLPFDLSGRSVAEVERLILEQGPEKPSLTVRRKGAPAAVSASRSSWADLDVLGLTAMHKDVQRRYRSVEAFIRDIDHYLNGEPLEARPDTRGYRIGKFVRRNRRAVGATVAAVAITATLVIFFTVRLAIAKNTAVAAWVRTQRMQEFMLNLIEGGDKSAGPAGDLRVVTIIDRGVKEAQTLRREPAVQAALYMMLGGVYQRLGNLGQADFLLTAALKQREALFGSASPEVTESLVALGLLRVEQARLREAEQLVREGLDLTRRIRPQNDGALGLATTALGKVLEAEGSYDKAIPVLQQAVAIEYRLAPQSPELADAVKELADTQFYAGHYSDCENLTRQALAIHRRLFGDKHPLVGDDLIDLGAVQFERGHYSDFERFYRQALDIHQAWYGKDNPAAATTLSMLGRALVFENRFDEATSLMQSALAIQERAYSSSHPPDR